MRSTDARVRLALVLMLADCGHGGGADGEHPTPPDRDRAVAHMPAAAGTAPDADAGTPAPVDAALDPTVFLDVPPGSLDAWFSALAAAERQEPGARVLVTVFGDSHTASDLLTSPLRTAWQARFGDAGRGLVAAGKPPTKHYTQRDVHYGATGAWHVAIGGPRDSEPFGIAGERIYGSKRGAQLWVETCAECKAGTATADLEVWYQAAPGHGSIKVRVDEAPWQTLSTALPKGISPHPDRLVLTVPDGPHRLTLEHAGGGVVDLFGVVLERPRPGVIVDALGVVGRRLGSLRSWDWHVIGAQLAMRAPRLVVLQYGTNEADDPDLVLDDLAHYYDDVIARIRAAVPGTAIAILGPPDLGVRAGGSRCASAEDCAWRTPTVLLQIIGVEHAAAVRNRVAFFDTFAAMGGADQMDAWATADPRIAYGDHTHFTALGYQRWADALSTALLAAYATWRSAHDVPGALPAPPAR